MKSEQQAGQLREALAMVERSGAGRPYPESLRQAALEYCRRREREGVGLHRAASELGLSTTTLQRWSRQRPTFRAIELASAPDKIAEASRPPRLTGSLMVHGPRGLRIEGLTVEELAELLVRLS